MKKTVVWLHSHLSHPMGGTKYIWETASRLVQQFPDDITRVVVIAQHGTPKVVREFENRGIEVALLDEPSTDSPQFWAWPSRSVKNSARKLRALLANYENPIALASMYPAQWILAEAGVGFAQLIYEPFAYFWDDRLLRASGAKVRAAGILLRTLYGQSDRKATQAATALLTLSDFTARQIEDVYGRADALPVFEGVDTDFFKPGVLQPDPWPGKRVIFHSTDFSGIKRTDVVFDAFAQLAPQRDDLLLAVSTTRARPDMEAVMRDRLRARGVDPTRAHFLGTLPYAELPLYYSRADLVLHPVVNQPMSFVVKEALACGTPVVRGNDVGCDFEDGVCGYLVDPDHVPQVAAACARVLDDEPLRRRLANAGRALVAERYRWDAVTRKIGKVLLELH